MYMMGRGGKSVSRSGCIGAYVLGKYGWPIFSIQLDQKMEYSCWYPYITIFWIYGDVRDIKDQVVLMSAVKKWISNYYYNMV